MVVEHSFVDVYTKILIDRLDMWCIVTVIIAAAMIVLLMFVSNVDDSHKHTIHILCLGMCIFVMIAMPIRIYYIFGEINTNYAIVHLDRETVQDKITNSDDVNIITYLGDDLYIVSSQTNLEEPSEVNKE